jgi:hypothetical protein
MVTIKPIDEYGLKLREELLPFYYRRVLKPSGDFKGGCGTPFLCQHPDDGTIYFLFTGWPDPASQDGREVYVGEINEAFEVSNIRKLIKSNFPTTDYPTHAAVSALYDPYNDQWIVMTGSGSYGSRPGLPASHFEVCLWRFNRDFTRLVSYQVPLSITPEGGASQVWSTDDISPNLVRVEEPEKCAYFITMGSLGSVTQYKNMYWGWTEDISAPVPTFVRQTTPLVSKLTGDAYGGSLMGMDVHSLIMSRYGFMALVEATGPESFWRLFPIYINKTPETTELAASRHALGGMGFDALLHPAAIHDTFQFGHPHLTLFPDSKLNLFFTFFRRHHPDWRHEIWHVKFTEDMFEPARQRAIYWTPWYNQSIQANEASLPWWSFGKTTIYFTSNVSGNLSIEVSPAGSVNDWWTLDTLTGITSAVYQTTYEAKAMRLRFSQAATVTAIVVVNPRG